MCIPMLNEPCMRELKWEECKKNHSCGLMRLFVSAFFNSLSSMALVMCVMYVCIKRELCREMHRLPHPFFMSSSLDQSVSSSASQVTDLQTPSTSHPLTSYCGEDFQGKLIILYYSWIEPKGTCRISSLHFLFLYLPRVFDSGCVCVFSCQMSNIRG